MLRLNEIRNDIENDRYKCPLITTILDYISDREIKVRILECFTIN